MEHRGEPGGAVQPQAQDHARTVHAAQAAPGVWIGPGIFKAAVEVEDTLAELGEKGDYHTLRTVGELVDLWLRIARAETKGQAGCPEMVITACADEENDTHMARLLVAAHLAGMLRLTIEAPDIPGVFRRESAADAGGEP